MEHNKFQRWLSEMRAGSTRSRRRRKTKRKKGQKSKSHAENMHNAEMKKLWEKCRKLYHNNASSGRTSHPVRQSVSQALQEESQLFINEANLLLNLCRLRRLSLEELLLLLLLLFSKSNCSKNARRANKARVDSARDSKSGAKGKRGQVDPCTYGWRMTRVPSSVLSYLNPGQSPGCRPSSCCPPQSGQISRTCRECNFIVSCA